jgi:hypothetical protein
LKLRLLKSCLAGAFGSLSSEVGAAGLGATPYAGVLPSIRDERAER